MIDAALMRTLDFSHCVHRRFRSPVFATCRTGGRSFPDSSSDRAQRLIRVHAALKAHAHKKVRTSTNSPFSAASSTGFGFFHHLNLPRRAPRQAPRAWRAPLFASIPRGYSAVPCAGRCPRQRLLQLKDYIELIQSTSSVGGFNCGACLQPPSRAGPAAPACVFLRGRPAPSRPGPSRGKRADTRSISSIVTHSILRMVSCSLLFTFLYSSTPAQRVHATLVDSIPKR